MKFWMSGEIQSDVSDAFRRSCNKIEPSLNGFLEHKNYGKGLVKWSFIAIILSENGPKGYNEVKRYNKRDKTCEFRLLVDHGRFRDGGTKEHNAMICEALLRSLSLLAAMKVPDFDLSALQADFLEHGRNQGWLS
jgi:hypothetical protein